MLWLYTHWNLSIQPLSLAFSLAFPITPWYCVPFTSYPYTVIVKPLITCFTFSHIFGHSGQSVSGFFLLHFFSRNLPFPRSSLIMNGLVQHLSRLPPAIRCLFFHSLSRLCLQSWEWCLYCVSCHTAVSVFLGHWQCCGCSGTIFILKVDEGPSTSIF